MSAQPPEANTEYSRGSGPLWAVSGPSAGADEAGDSGAHEGHDSSVSGAISGGSARGRSWVQTTIALGGLVGALLLLVAEFTTLLQVHVSGSAAPVHSVSTGSHNSYALVPIALLAGAFAVAVWRTGSRPALLGLGLLGLVSLLIAVLGDLPDASSAGTVIRGGHYVAARSDASTGLYLETLGAVVLIVTCVCGFLLIGMPTGGAAGRAGAVGAREGETP